METVESSTTVGRLNLLEKIGRVTLVVVSAAYSATVILDPSVERVHK